MFKVKEIIPLFNQVVTTMDKYKEVMTNSGIFDATRTNRLKEYQTVIAVGPMVKGIKPGDVVFINPRRYMQIDHRNGRTDLEKNIIQDEMHAYVSIPQYQLYDRPDGSCRNVLMIFDNDVIFVARGEEFDETNGLFKPVNPLTDVEGYALPDNEKKKS